MPLVVPTPVPPYPPAPQPTDDRVTFSTKAFSLAASYEPQRLAFNIALDQVYTNAQWAQAKALDAQNSATAAGQSASAANTSRQAADAAVQDVRDALDAIQAGPVASVMGRTGVVTGLVETDIGATRNKSQLMANAPIGQWAAFYDFTGVGPDWPPAHPNTNWWNVFTFGSEELGQVTQRASQTLATGFQGWIYERQRDSAAWGPWQRILGAGSLIENWEIATITAGACTIDPEIATIWWIEPASNVSIYVRSPRGAGDQLTLRLMQRGGWSFSFSGNNIKFPAGAPGLQLSPNELLTVTLIGEFGGNGMWNLFIGGKHTA
jgi:hypothetical protein